jgi:hypothetical protein
MMFGRATGGDAPAFLLEVLWIVGPIRLEKFSCTSIIQLPGVRT